MKKQTTTTKAQREAANYRVALDEFPEFAAQVGILISCFAVIESYAHLLISKLTGAPAEDAFVFSGSFMNFRARIELLESLAKRRNPSDDAAKIARYFVGLLREATDIRNRYAHGRYSLTFEGGQYSSTAKKLMYIDTSLFDAKKMPKKIVRDLPALEAEVKRIKLIICEIHAYLYRNEAPCVR
ncbi:MAG TPA: hypothetical protein VN873_19780 [Candidatus Angelobacter sp.]|nr:hypothetical protein [Candidatus Angelobacter sp.]